MNWRPAPPGPFPPGQAWYPLLGKWGPAHIDIPDEVLDDGWFNDEALTPEREGEIIPICNLELVHLRNIIRMIERGILAARERTGKGARTLAERAKSDERVRNLLNEWLRRF